MVEGTWASEARKRRYGTENPKQLDVQDEMLKGPDCWIRIKDPYIRWQLHLNIERTSEDFDGRAFRLEFVKRAPGVTD
jgi:hypothetical protein